MGKAKFHWETDLIDPPFSNESSNNKWMEHVEKRLMKKKSLFIRLTPLIGSGAVITLALILILANGDQLRSLFSPVWSTMDSKVSLTEGSTSMPVTSDQESEKFHVVEGLTIEEGAEILISKKADLLDSMKGSTIALIHSPLTPEQGNTEYLGIWDAKGKRIQKFIVEGYMMNPVDIHVTDVTGDGNSDIILETDENANGGLGAHALHIYVEDKGQYKEAPLPEEINTNYTVTFRPSSNDFNMISTGDKRSWTVQMAEDQLKELDATLLKQSNAVNVDPISSIDVQDHILITKRLIWFGNLQLNSLAILATSYHFEDNKWNMKSYSLEDVKKGTVVTEIK